MSHTIARTPCVSLLLATLSLYSAVAAYRDTHETQTVVRRVDFTRENSTTKAENSTTNSILLFHGITEDFTRLSTLVKRLRKGFPGAMVHAIRLFPHAQSLLPLEFQSRELRKYIEDMNLTTPITLIGHSQGALIMRHMIQNWPGHSISTFISLSGPHVGACSIPGHDLPWLQNATISSICYSSRGQLLSLCNIWNDPQEQELFITENNFLSTSVCLSAQSCADQATNLGGLGKLVLGATLSDDTVVPYESSLLGYYNSEWEIVPRHKQPFYTALRLKEMEERGALEQCIISGKTHQEMVTDEEVYKACVKPHIAA